jgi:hypothetical protein
MRLWLALATVALMAAAALANSVVFVRPDRAFFNGRGPVWVAGHGGYIDRNGHLAIFPRYDSAYPFCGDGWARVGAGHETFFVDEHGWAKARPLGQLSRAYCFSEGLLPTMDGMVDSRGKLVLRTRDAEGFSEGLASAKAPDGKYGFIDRRGTFVIAPQFESAWPFAEGLAPVSTGAMHNGYVDRRGKLVIPLHFLRTLPFQEGKAGVNTAGRGYPFVIIDRRGHLASNAYDDGWGFSEGFAGVQCDGKWGFIDRRGRLVIPFAFDMVGEFSSGLTAAQVGDLWGYIDRRGKWVIAPRFLMAGDFSEGFAFVKTEEGDEYIDRRGYAIWTTHDGEREAALLAAAQNLALAETEALPQRERAPQEFVPGQAALRSSTVLGVFPFASVSAATFDRGCVLHLLVRTMHLVPERDSLGNQHRWYVSLLHMERDAGGWSAPEVVLDDVGSRDARLAADDHGALHVLAAAGDQLLEVTRTPNGWSPPRKLIEHPAKFLWSADLVLAKGRHLAWSDTNGLSADAGFSLPNAAGGVRFASDPDALRLYFVENVEFRLNVLDAIHRNGRWNRGGPVAVEAADDELAGGDGLVAFRRLFETHAEIVAFDAHGASEHILLPGSNPEWSMPAIARDDAGAPLAAVTRGGDVYLVKNDGGYMKAARLVTIEGVSNLSRPEMLIGGGNALVFFTIRLKNGDFEIRMAEVPLSSLSWTLLSR